MSNIKQIDIAGRMTFDASPGEMKDGIWHDLANLSAVARSSTRTDEALRLLGQIGLPTIGLTITWKGQEMVENNHGGQMAMMGFSITGQEAWSWDALRKLVETLNFVGQVEFASARDFEEEGPVNLLAA